VDEERLHEWICPSLTVGRGGIAVRVEHGTVVSEVAPIAVLVQLFAEKCARSRWIGRPRISIDRRGACCGVRRVGKCLDRIQTGRIPKDDADQHDWPKDIRESKTSESDSKSLARRDNGESQNGARRDDR